MLNDLSTNMNWFQDDQIWKPVLRALLWSLYGLLIPQVSSCIHLVYCVLNKLLQEYVRETRLVDLY